MPHDAAVTAFLHRVRDGDQGALEQLIPVVYNELRRIAESYLRQERPGHTLQATALVHEAYLRMVNQDQPAFENRAHFYGIAAQVMRQVLVDHARARLAGKRGGGVQKVSWNDSLDFTSEKASLIVALDDAMRDLAQFDARKARLIELRFFGGLTAEETAEVIGLSVHVVRHEMRFARAWLHRYVAEQRTGGDAST